MRNNQPSLPLREDSGNFEQWILDKVSHNRAISVRELYEVLQKQDTTLTERALTDSIWRLVDRGAMTVLDVPIRSFIAYLKCWERNLWFYQSLAASALAVILTFLVPENDFPAVLLRWVFGTALVMFIPGYLAVEALFPKYNDLNGVERSLLGVVLSGALVGVIGFLLDQTAGFTFGPMILSLAALSFTLAAIASVSQFRAQLGSD